ncbi:MULTISPECIES: hypothetical protein [Pseudomonas]|uniref:hypothetical protein n=1 Tax=Pseudomonas TaxID=286 RepID=UPI0009438BFE|nr:MULTISPECIES: hypothetical protein [Pseudomonas]
MTQYARVLAVLEGAEKPLALFEINERIEARFNRKDSEAAISARIRDIRHDLELKNAGSVSSAKAKGAQWCRYWLFKPSDDLANSVSSATV